MNTLEQKLERSKKEAQRKEIFIKRYLNQEVKLHEEAKELITKHELGKITLYALIDLNDQLKLENSWLILTNTHVVTITGSTERSFSIANSFMLSEISDIREVRSLSCTSLVFMSAGKSKALAKFQFTHRQKVIMGHIKYLCENWEREKSRESVTGLNADEEYQKAIMKPIVEAQNSITTENSQTLWRLLSYLAPYRRELIQGTLGAVATTVVSLVPAYLSGKLVDDIIQPFQNGSLSLKEASSIGWTMVAALALTYILRELFIFIRLNKMSILGEKVAKDLREELYSHLQSLSMDYFSKKQTGSIISRVSSDTDRIWDFIAFGVIEVGVAVLTLLGLSAVLMALDFKLGLVMALPVPLLLFAIYSHGERMKILFLKAWRKWSNLTSVLSDTIPGIQVVKAFNQERKEIKRFKRANESVTSEFNGIHSEWTKFWPLLMLSFQLIVTTVWIFAMPRLIGPRGSGDTLTAGTFVSFLLYMTMFAQPIETLGQVARMLNRALSSAYRIFEVFDTRATIAERELPLNVGKLEGRIEFKNVFFSYDGIRPIIQDLSFKVKPGEMIGFVGSSGGGKSTITKLITRFYDVNGGQILIDGIDLRDLAIGPFRKQVGMVLQEPYLFHGSIRDNISYSSPSATVSEIIEAAKIANAHNFIGKLPLGYDTVIGERGHTLSGGERQRVSIARAVLANPRVLILDEATSAVDTETERNIQDALDKLIQGRTVFAIAHRLSTLRKADRIFVIGKGSITEQGTHLELLEKKGEYAKLHQMQQEMSEGFITQTLQ